MRHSILSLGFTKLIMAVVIVIMKSHIGHIHLKTATLQLIRYNIEATLLEIGLPNFLY